jgi:transcriptional regulator with XRE-family HTH domain
MTPADFLAARKSFRLTQPEWGVMLGLSKSQIFRIEQGRYQVEAGTRRLVEAYLAGYRPADWPDKSAPAARSKSTTE